MYNKVSQTEENKKYGDSARTNQHTFALLAIREYKSNVAAHHQYYSSSITYHYSYA